MEEQAAALFREAAARYVAVGLPPDFGTLSRARRLIR
jgi:hypothetical protein